MISFDEFLKQDDEEKYNNMQRDNFEIQTLKNDLDNRDIYINKLEEAYSKHLERLNNIIENYKKYTENIDKWINYNLENGAIYFYDPTPFPKLEILDKGRE